MKQTYGMFAFIGWGIEHDGLVRAHLKYSVLFWSPHYRKDMVILGRMQGKITRISPELMDRLD